MNPLATALNEALEGTPVFNLLSDLGKRMYFPKGIVAQAAEAKERAHRWNASVGMAYEKGQPMTLPVIKELLPGFTTEESVAYSPTAGVKALRERWLTEMRHKNPALVGKTVSLPIVVPGLTPGILVTADLFFDKDDELVLPDLYWGNYNLIFEERRCAKMTAFSFFDDDGQFNRSAFRTAVFNAAESGAVRAILNFPNNPAGYTPTYEDAEFIIETFKAAADRVPTLVILDDAYFGLLFNEEAYPQSLFGELAGAHQNLVVVKVDGATKEDYVWGFRVGFVTFGGRGISAKAIRALEQKYMGAVRSAVSNSSTLSQNVLLKAFDHPRYHRDKREAFEKLHKRYKELQNILTEKARNQRAPMLEPLPCNSGYFMSFRCRGLSAEALRLALLDRGVGVISVKDTYLRVAFAGVEREDLPLLYAEIFSTAESLESNS